MYKLNKILVLALIVFFQTSCSSNIDTYSLSDLSSTQDGENITTTKKSFTQFQDIPIPD